MTGADGVVPDDLAARVKAYADELVAFRRDLHAHPELSWAEVRTTRMLKERLVEAGLDPRVLPGGTGLTCDVGSGDRVVGLRADIDALPIVDGKDVPYASTVAGVCHACGHDVHASMVLGAGLVLADPARRPTWPTVVLGSQCRAKMRSRSWAPPASMTALAPLREDSSAGWRISRTRPGSPPSRARSARTSPAPSTMLACTS